MCEQARDKSLVQSREREMMRAQLDARALDKIILPIQTDRSEAPRTTDLILIVLLVV